MQKITEFQRCSAARVNPPMSSFFIWSMACIDA